MRDVLTRDARKLVTVKFNGFYDKAIAGEMVLQSHSLRDVWSRVWLKDERDTGEGIEIHLPATVVLRVLE